MPRQLKQQTMELSDAHHQGYYTIGEASAKTGISPKMIRYYESQKLISLNVRTLAGYRVYQAKDLHVLRFIKRARDLGFSIKQISVLVSLWQDEVRTSAEVKKLALEHIQEMDQRIRAMQEMRDQLSDLATLCQGDHRPDCPILQGIEEGACCEH